MGFLFRGSHAGLLLFFQHWLVLTRSIHVLYPYSINLGLKNFSGHMEPSGTRLEYISVSEGLTKLYYNSRTP